jgi:hypothetical protein
MAENSLLDVVNGVMLDSSNQDQIVPTWIANEAYRVLDPDFIAPSRVRLGCIEHLKQIARQICRKTLEPQNVDEVESQGALWDLQKHYPQAHSQHSDEPVYIKRELMTWEDIIFNHNRMDNAGDSLKAHAKRLLQYGIDRGLKPAQKAA